MLGGGYGRRVVVVAGKGNNGADGRAAAARLRRRGVRVEVVDAADPPPVLPRSDLVVDAAYGTGFRGEYHAPDPAGAPVLAVDIPSGVDGLTGAAGGEPVRADRTVTFAALKPGLLLGEGFRCSGTVTVADIGLDTSPATAWVVEQPDLRAWLPPRSRESHKWTTALYVVAGSAGMIGAANLCSRAAMRAGAGTVRLAVPGVPPSPVFLEVVGRTVPATGWGDAVLADIARVKALAVGPGLSRLDDTRESVRHLLTGAEVPTVVDADGLYALRTADEAAEVLRAPVRAEHGTVLTPHDGEFARLAGSKPGPDRLGATRDLANRTGATVLLKGSTTIVADPDGSTFFSTAGDARLATAGTGDVLTGVIGAFLAQGLDPLRAAALGAFVHGAAGHLGWRRGLVAGVLLDALPAVLNREDR
jgi:NAD(P)H-hydrate epimerase